MKNISLIIVLFFTLNTFCQNDDNLTGIWLKESYKKKGLKFMENGAFDIYNPKEPNKKQLRIVVKYKTVTKGDLKYIVFSYYKDDKLIIEKEDKYKLQNGKLYLPMESESNGVITVSDYQDIYVRL